MTTTEPTTTTRVPLGLLSETTWLMTPTLARQVIDLASRVDPIQAATMNGALTLAEPKKQPIQFGVVKAGMLADMVIVDQNPLQNFKVLYGTGAVRLNDTTGRAERVGGIKYTIKDGIVYDAKKLMEDVAAMVTKQKAAKQK